MTKPLKIAILIGSLEQGGAQSMALRLLDGLERKGLVVYLLSLDRTREVLIHGVPERAAELDQRIIHLSRSNVRWCTALKVLMSPWQWLKLHLVCRKLQIDVLLSLMERANILNLLSLGRHKRIISIRKHPDMALSAKSPFKRWLIRSFYPRVLGRADRINLNSNWAARDFQALFAVADKKIGVIHNYLDQALVQEMARGPIPKAYAPLFDQPVIINCSRLTPAKGHAHLLRAFELAQQRSPELRLVILGDGRLKGHLVDLARRLGLAKVVVFPGYQGNPFPWMKRSSMFVLSSLSEGFPNVLLEAMSLGLPVISTDCPSGPREVLGAEDDQQSQFRNQTIETAYGLLTPRLDQDGARAVAAERALAWAMLRLYTDSPFRLKLARAARERAMEFSPEKQLQAWLDLLGKV